jgi:hypothetical protein
MAQRGGMTIEIERSLKGIHYPAKKQDLVNQAKQNNAAQDVLQTIKNLPSDNFNSPVDVQKAFGQERR